MGIDRVQSRSLALERFWNARLSVLSKVLVYQLGKEAFMITYNCPNNADKPKPGNFLGLYSKKSQKF